MQCQWNKYPDHESEKLVIFVKSHPHTTASAVHMYSVCQMPLPCPSAIENINSSNVSLIPINHDVCVECHSHLHKVSCIICWMLSLPSLRSKSFPSQLCHMYLTLVKSDLVSHMKSICQTSLLFPPAVYVLFVNKTKKTPHWFPPLLWHVFFKCHSHQPWHVFLKCHSLPHQPTKLRSVGVLLQFTDDYICSFALCWSYSFSISKLSSK